MKLQEAIISALSGDSILFLGSGASVGAINYNDVELVTGTRLANRIYNGCDDLQQAVDFFIDDKESDGLDGKKELITFLEDEFNVKQITEAQKLIPSVPWKRIYTTNYDNVVEKAYDKENKKIFSATVSSNAASLLSKKDLIYLHINGYINNLSKEKLNSEFKLSDESYNNDSFTKSKWGELFRMDLKNFSSIIFIGFSLRYDLDIKRILSKYINNFSKEKIFFIVAKDEPENNVRYLKKYGCVESIGMDGFFNQVNSIQKSFIPLDEAIISNTRLTNFEQVNNEFIAEDPTDKQVLSFYQKGKRNNNLFYRENNKYKAIIERDVINKIKREINNGVQAVFIHSDIGNGKTEIIEQLCYEIPKKYAIYHLIDYNDKISQEIESICKTNNKKIIIIENFFNYYEVYKLFELYGEQEDIVYIFTARTSIYQSRYLSFSFNKISTHDVNRLSSNEADELSRIFDSYGFYPKDQIENMNFYIKKNCKSKLQNVLLQIFDNQQVSQSLLQVTNRIQQTNDTFYRIVLFMVTLKVMTLDLDYEDVLNLLETGIVDYSFEKNTDICEIVDFDGKKTSIKSVILCVWMIKHCYPDDIIDILIQTARTADIASSINKKYLNFLGNIISYKHLKFIFNYFSISNSKKLELINKFYEKIKNLSYYQNKYFFWLQYGISALEMKDYKGAELHFNTAYNKLPDGNSPFEINNQYARLLMEKMLLDTYKHDNNTASEIQEINKLLTPTNAESDDEFYCYKMSASYYPSLFKKFYSSMNTSEQTMLCQIARDKYNMCSKYMKYNTNNNFMERAKDFCDIFLKLSYYNNDIIVDFTVTKITDIFAYGYIIYKEKKENAAIHISQLSEKYTNKVSDVISIGDIKKAQIVKFDSKRHIFLLSLKRVCSNFNS